MTFGSRPDILRLNGMNSKYSRHNFRRVAQVLSRRLQGLELILLGAHAANRTTRPFRLGVYSRAEGALPFGLQGWGFSGMPRGLEASLREGRTPLHHLQLLSAAAATHVYSFSLEAFQTTAQLQASNS